MPQWILCSGTVKWLLRAQWTLLIPHCILRFLLSIFIYYNIPIFYQVREQFCSYDEDKDGRITDEEMEIGMTINKVNLEV